MTFKQATLRRLPINLRLIKRVLEFDTWKSHMFHVRWHSNTFILVLIKWKWFVTVLAGMLFLLNNSMHKKFFFFDGWNGHRHCEHEGWALILTLRIDIDCAPIMLDNFCANIKTHSDSIFIFLLSALDLTKKLENCFHFLFLNTFALVNYINAQHLPFLIVLRLNLNLLSNREFHSVLCQIY